MREPEVSLVLRLKDMLSGPMQRTTRDWQRQTERAAESSTRAITRSTSDQQRAFSRLASARQSLGIRSEQAIQREIRQTEAAYNRLARSGTLSANEQGRAFRSMTDRVRDLRREMGQVERTQRSISDRARTLAGIGVGAVAAWNVISKPMERNREYSLRLAYVSSTAYAGQSLAARQAGKERIRHAVSNAVDQGGGTREDALSAYGSLVGSGQFNADESASMLPRIMRFATANDVSATQAADLALAAKQFGYGKDQLETFFDQSVRSGQGGGFEVNMMASALAKQSAVASQYGMRGEKDFAELLTLNQMARTTAGSQEEAGNNAFNLLRKILSPDTLKDFKNQGIDLSGSIAAARGRGAGVISSFTQAVDAVVSKDKRFATLKNQIANAKDDTERKELLEKNAKIIEGSAIGKVLQDAEALKAFMGLVSDAAKTKSLMDSTRAENAKGANADNWELISGEAAIQRMRREAASADASDRAFSGMVSTIGDLDKAMADVAKEFPGVATAASTATKALELLAFVAGSTALFNAVTGKGNVLPTTKSITERASQAAPIVSRLTGSMFALTSIANFTTNEEDAAIKDWDQRMADLNNKYGPDTVKAARKKFQPWYEVGEGYPADNEKWIKQLLESQSSRPIQVTAPIYLDGRQIAEYTSASMNREAIRR